jgi:ATP-dependent DNA helicase RecQ
MLSQERPELLRWLTPQAPLEALAGRNESTSRWVDFLFWHPGGQPVVVEIDGSGHVRQRGVDRERDRLLSDARIDVVRLDGGKSLDLEHVMDRLGKYLPGNVDAPSEVAPHDTLRLLLVPAALHRLGYAIVEGAARRFLPAGEPWVIDLDESLGVVAQAAGPVLDLLASVDDLWATAVVPGEVRVGPVTWHRSGERFKVSSSSFGETQPHMRVVLDTDRPAQAQLPVSDEPQVVIRQAFLPGRFAWVPGGSRERRDVDGVAPGTFKVLLNELFGLGDFRDGQLPPLERVLSGKDCAVMLPTGAGKSLIYQMAALLRPGIAVIVDPIVSLVDDQARRLNDEGIDRVSALHAASLRQAISREVAYEAVASGDSLFVFVTPERLQIQSFREYLGGAAGQQLVNLAVVDEAHCVSEWGHDFRTSYLRLGRNLRYLCRSEDDVPPPILALTGTASPAVLRDVLRELDIDPSEVGALQRPSTFDRPNLYYRVVADVPSRQREHLRRLLVEDLADGLDVNQSKLFEPSGRETTSGLVFVPHTNGKHGVAATRQLILDLLAKEGLSAEVEIYSGQCPRDFDSSDWDEVKRKAADRFKGNEASVLVSTKAFGMGIDKPNIRYTVHLGFPSSIEAFAQEAGRAGRDGSRAVCVIIGAQPDRRRAQQLLDLGLDREERRGLYESDRDRRADDDLARQLYFLYGSFPSAGDELAASSAVFDELWAAGRPGAEVAIPRELRAKTTEKPLAGTALQREKGLYRLSILGVVDDYTIDYGAGVFTVFLDYFDAASIDAALLAYAQRVEPGRLAAHERGIASAPHDLAQRVRHHLGVEIDMLYRVIEPARVRALDEMYRLTLDDPSGDDVRRRINAYLGDGPLAAILPSLISGANWISIDEIIRALETVPPVDPFEWAGATARQLEDTPEHPVALAASALAQAWLPNGDPERFQDLLSAALVRLAEYDVSESDAVKLFLWILQQLRNQIGGRRRHWCAVAWLTLPGSLGDDFELIEEEQRVLDQPMNDPLEARAVLGRRVLRDAREIDEYVLAQAGERRDG